MRLTIGDWRFDIDVKRTRAYYEKLRGREINNPVLRNHCAVMEKHVSPRILRLMSRLGIVEHSGFRYAECLNLGGGIHYGGGAYPLFGHVVHISRPGASFCKHYASGRIAAFTMFGHCSAINGAQPAISHLLFQLSRYDGDNNPLQSETFGDMDGNDVLLLYLYELSLPWVIDEPCPVLSDKQLHELDEIEIRKLATDMLTRSGTRFEFLTPDQRMTALKRCIYAFSRPGVDALLWDTFEEWLSRCRRPGYLNSGCFTNRFENLTLLTADTISDCYNSLAAEGYTLTLGCSDMCIHVQGALPPLDELDQFMAYDIYLFDDALKFCFASELHTSDSNYRIARRTV